MGYQVCHLIGGREDGDVVVSNVSVSPGGCVYTIRPSPAHPNHVALYQGDMPFNDETPTLRFAGWQTKDVSTTSIAVDRKD